jgi:shikimate dehydrogenase
MTASLASPRQGHLVLLLGHPLEHSRSPVMHNAAFRHQHLPWVYAPLDLMGDQVKAALHLLRFPGLKGANITVPYKEAVLPYLDGIEPEAKWLGSVNTIYKKGKRLMGASTDGEGFLRSLGSWRKKLRGTKGVLVGAGGAAKAVAGALARSHVKELWIVNRSRHRAVQLARSLQGRYGSLLVHAVNLREAERIVSECDWVVQSTSVGLKRKDPTPFSLQNARRSTWAIDLIYHHETTFLKEARKRGMPRLDGRGMLLHQGALSYEYWTGRKAPLKEMRKALLRSLASSK